MKDKKIFCVGGPRNFIFIKDEGFTVHISYGMTLAVWDSAVALDPIAEQRYKTGTYRKTLLVNNNVGKGYLYIWEELTNPQAIDLLKDHLLDKFMGELSE